MLNSIPLRFVANTSSQALSLISSNFTVGKMPAFAQRMSTPPNSAATVAMTSSISPCCLTSPRQKIAVLPRPRRAFTVAAPSGSFRPSTQTRAPSWAKTPAMPLPMPLVPPVTMTDLFLIDVSTESFLFIRSACVSVGLFFGKPANEIYMEFFRLIQLLCLGGVQQKRSHRRCIIAEKPNSTLQSLSASIEGVCVKTLQNGKLFFEHKPPRITTGASFRDLFEARFMLDSRQLT